MQSKISPAPHTAKNRYRQVVGHAHKLNGFFRKNKQKQHYFTLL